MRVDKTTLTKLLIENNVLKFGDFTLKSGKKSWFYIDLRLIPSFPEFFDYVIKCYIQIIKNTDNFDAVAGVAVAGVPFSSVIGYKLQIPSIIIRSNKKDHGLQKKIEGYLSDGSTIIMIDDLITTGSSKIPGILALRDRGFKIKDMVVLIDRSQGHLDEIVRIGVKLHSMITIEEIFEICLTLDNTILSEENKKLIKNNL